MPLLLEIECLSTPISGEGGGSLEDGASDACGIEGNWRIRWPGGSMNGAYCHACAWEWVDDGHFTEILGVREQGDVDNSSKGTTGRQSWWEKPRASSLENDMEKE